MKVLKLSAQGLPQSWISLEQAVIHYAADEVRWESGGEVAVFHGGTNAITGQQSIITVNSIIGTKGVPNINPFDLKPGLTTPSSLPVTATFALTAVTTFTKLNSPASTSGPTASMAWTIG